MAFVRRYAILALRYFLSAVLSTVSVAIAGTACVWTRYALRGRNYSDVGVPLYEHNDVATLAGLFVFAAILFALLYALQRTLGRNSPWFPYLVAAIACILAQRLLFFVFFW